MNQQEREQTERVLVDIKDLLIRKNYGYGRNVQRHGLKGVVIRIADKTQRLENIVLGKRHDMVEEEIQDTLVDMAGYAVWALTLMDLGDLSRDGEWVESNGVEEDACWPGEEEEDIEPCYTHCKQRTPNLSKID